MTSHVIKRFSARALTQCVDFFVGLFLLGDERMIVVALYFLVLEGVISLICSQPIDSFEDDIPMSDMVGSYLTNSKCVRKNNILCT